MEERVDEINLLIAGEKTSIFDDAKLKLEKQLKRSFNIKIMYLNNEYFQTYNKLIDEDGNYFNIIAVNYRTEMDILNFFQDFNKNYKETFLTTSSYPFFLVDKTIYKKSSLFNEIKKINKKRPDLYKYYSKDIIEYDNESLPIKLLRIYNK